MADVGEVRYKVAVDTGKIDDQISESEEKFKKLGKAVASASDKIKALIAKMSGFEAGKIAKATEEAEKFKKALDKANGDKIKSLQNDISTAGKELNEVNEALEKMPKSIGLASEKYKLTKEQIRAAKEEVKELKKVQEQAKEAFKSGDISEGAYRAIKRDVLEAQASLKDLKKDGKEAFSTLADTAGAVTGVNKLKSALSKTGSLGLTALKGIGTAFVGLTTAAATGVTAVAKMGIEYNAQMQSYQTAFTTMLGDAEKAQALTDNLKTLAAKTPLAMTDLADASQILLAFGSSAEELPNQLKRLGDVAQGDAQALGTMATAFGRIQSNGYASLEEINMMIDQGFNPLQIIADKTGESMAEVRDRVSDGKVSFEELNEALITATDSGGQFYNAMENQSKTFEGQMSTLQDNISALTGALTEDLFNDLASNALPKVNGWVDELMTAAEEGGAEGAIEAAGTVLTEMITELLNGAPKLIETATSLVKSFLNSVKENGPEIMQAGVQVLLELINGLIEISPMLLETAGVLIASLLEAFAKVDWIQVGKDVVNGIIDGLASMGGVLWDAAKNLASKALNSLKSAFDSHSPSKKAEKIADTVPQGIVKSFDEDRLVEDAGKRLGSKAIAGLTADVNYNLPDVTSYARSLTADFTPSYRASTAITVPLYLDGREVARATAWWTGEQLSWEEM